MALECIRSDCYEELSVLVLRRHLLGTVCCGKNYLSLHADLKVAATASKELNPNFGKGDGPKHNPGTDNDAPLWYKTSYNQPTERRRDLVSRTPVLRTLTFHSRQPFHSRTRPSAGIGAGYRSIGDFIDV